MQIMKCDSLNISYDVHGVATINFTLFSDDITKIDIPDEFGGVEFDIIATDASIKEVGSSGVYQIIVSALGVTNSDK